MNTEELRKRFEENIPRRDHEDNDTFVCGSMYWNCTCGRSHHWGSILTKCSCGRTKSEGVYGDCNCGAQKEYEDQFDFFLSEISQAEQRRTEEIVEYVDCEHKMLANELAQKFLPRTPNQN